ncbi:hypothetical protein JOB18_039300 [Solea senegalensis]|uniref:K Homology domain-containing protein n=1 Tax=Solea senegalensis TaxID=28829 RepID=A0AAV6PJE2_SOLSE|nr:hypothetical protein JOB18_039300 [Solea senegalensis]
MSEHKPQPPDSRSCPRIELDSTLELIVGRHGGKARRCLDNAVLLRGDLLTPKQVPHVCVISCSAVVQS